jgi:hypothetical protein
VIRVSIGAVVYQRLKLWLISRAVVLEGIAASPKCQYHRQDPRRKR